MSNIISNNSDFLFLYEAIQCNPNGDPDQENKPRMDYDTDTNIVTDTRVKRYIRDYLKAEGTDIFVDMEGNSKVASDTKLEAVLSRLLVNSEEVAIALEEDPELLKTFKEIIEKMSKATGNDLFKYLQGPKKPGGKHEPPHPKINFALLAYLVKLKFLDVRLFGSAFAIATFNKSCEYWVKKQK